MGAKAENDKGLAPSYAALWRQFSLEVDKEQNSLQGEPVAPPASEKHKRQPSSLEGEPDALPAREKHQRQRMRRWSRRWRVVQGRYKAGLRLPLETLREKATVDSEM